jgi:MerR family transcriptional regulator/heat shock protein HspR
MDEQYITRIVLRQYQSSPSYSEQETATACHLSLNVIRSLRASGLIGGEEIDGETRYREEEVAQLRRVRRLQNHLGINLAGVEVILHLLKRLDALQQELEQEKARGHKETSP